MITDNKYFDEACSRGIKIIALTLFILLQLPVNKLFAEDDKKATITLSFSQADSTNTCTAKVMADNKPVKDAEVHFYVKRTYHPLPIGKGVVTDDSGECMMTFPTDLPGDQNGNLIVIAKIEDNDTYGTVETQSQVKWGIMPGMKNDEWNKRSLSASREKAPMFLIIGSNLIIAVIWGTIIYVFLQIFRIKKHSRIIKQQSVK